MSYLVQEKWYQELTNAFIQHSLDFVFVGFGVVILALIVGIVEFYQTGQVPTGTNLMFLGLGTISIGVACLSLKIAKESDKRVNSIANDNFLRVTGELEDRRIEMNFVENFAQFHRINTWKCLTYMKEANKLLDSCRIDRDNVNRLVSLFEKFTDKIKRVEDVKIEIKYMDDGKVIKTESKKLEIACEELSHILSMYQYFFKLEEKVRSFIPDYNIDKETKENAIKHLGEIMKENKKKKIDLEYIEDKKNKLSKLIKENEDIKNKPYLEILDKLK